MANNRMYLRCNECGDEMFFGKCLGEGYYRPPTEEMLQAFFDEHESCTLAAEEEANFRLVYEIAPKGEPHLVSPIGEVADEETKASRLAFHEKLEALRPK